MNTFLPCFLLQEEWLRVSGWLWGAGVFTGAAETLVFMPLSSGPHGKRGLG